MEKFPPLFSENWMKADTMESPLEILLYNPPEAVNSSRRNVSYL